MNLLQKYIFLFRLPRGKAEVQVGFKHPFAYEFKAAVSTDETIFDIDIGFSIEEKDNKFLRLGAAVPALGIHPNDLRVKALIRIKKIFLKLAINLTILGRICLQGSFQE